MMPEPALVKEVVIITTPAVASDGNSIGEEPLPPVAHEDVDALPTAESGGAIVTATAIGSIGAPHEAEQQEGRAVATFGMG